MYDIEFMRILDSTDDLLEDSAGLLFGYSVGKGWGYLDRGWVTSCFLRCSRIARRFPCITLSGTAVEGFRLSHRVGLYSDDGSASRYGSLLKLAIHLLRRWSSIFTEFLLLLSPLWVDGWLILLSRMFLCPMFCLWSAGGTYDVAADCLASSWV